MLSFSLFFYPSSLCLAFQELRILKNETEKKAEASQNEACPSPLLNLLIDAIATPLQRDKDLEGTTLIINNVKGSLRKNYQKVQT